MMKEYTMKGYAMKEYAYTYDFKTVKSAGFKNIFKESY